MAEILFLSVNQLSALNNQPPTIHFLPRNSSFLLFFTSASFRPFMPSPEELAREKIDRLLTDCGWTIQNRSTINFSVARGVAIREALLKGGDEVDYLLLVDGKAIGTVEAKPEGYTLTGVEEQSGKYGKGLLDIYPKWREPLPFAYESTGVETQFTNQLDPSPKSRNVFAFHKPETLLEYLEPNANLNTRLTNLLTTDQMPKSNLWSAQIEAIRNLEKSLAANKRRALIQMATSSGKTYTAVNFVYRLIKLAGARRVLFLVDRGNLGDQTLKEFQQFVTPDDGRKFTELYNVQHLQSAQLDRVSRVCISTIQRLYSMLRSLFFWIKTLMPQGLFTRGDRQRVACSQRSESNVLANTIASARLG
jgi:type I restriction enzyme, R subunit